MTFTLGLKPLSMDVELTKNSDFVSEIVNETGDWDPDEQLEIRFPDGTTFTADMVDDIASWHETKTVVNTLIATEPAYAYLFHIKTGVAELEWAAGPVIING